VSDYGKIRINGVDYGESFSLTTKIDDMSSTSDLTIGEGLKGEINEIIVLKKSLRDDQIDEIEEYLSRKWSIQLN
jgi:hypothetical protein